MDPETPFTWEAIPGCARGEWVSEPGKVSASVQDLGVCRSPQWATQFILSGTLTMKLGVYPPICACQSHFWDVTVQLLWSVPRAG